jgi:hypothetical protein
MAGRDAPLVVDAMENGFISTVGTASGGKAPDKQVLNLKDAVGRKFTIPFSMANTWPVS